MQQQQLNKCSVIMHVVQTELQLPSLMPYFGLIGYNPLLLKINRATAPFANVIIRLDRLQPPSLNNAYAMTQLKMQQQQHHINMLNQPPKIFTSTQDH